MGNRIVNRPLRWYPGGVVESRLIRLDVNGMFASMAGDQGLQPAELKQLTGRTAGVITQIGERRQAGELPFASLPYDEAGIARAAEVAAGLADRFETLVVLGIGGSALGARAAIEAGRHDAGPLAGMDVRILDNVDPATLTAALDELDLETTAFNVISKSGQTAETMAQFLIVRDRLLRKVGAGRYRDHVVATTDAEQGVLRAIADDEGFASLAVPQGVGGRFSVLSAVGLLPIAAAGLDLEALCAGARDIDLHTSMTDPWHNPAALHAMLLFAAQATRGASIHVLMPYCDGLLRLAEWYAQLWAESLGKKLALDGTTVEAGHTPVSALGATDQHSQVQLYVEGPRDKVVTFLRVEQHVRDLPIPSGYDDLEGVAYLSGHSLGELLNMEQRATELALAEAGRLASVIETDRLDEYAVGQLFHLFEVQTLVMAGLLGVNALDQPGVEAGKLMTYAMAGRTGYEDHAQRVRDRLSEKRADLVLP